MADYLRRAWFQYSDTEGTWGCDPVAVVLATIGPELTRMGIPVPDFGCIVCGPIRWWQIRRRRDFRRGRGCVHYGKKRPW